MKARRTLTGQEGFTLIEVLVASIIMGIALVGLTLLLSRGLMAVIAQGDTQIALHLAEQKIERLKGLGFSAAVIGNQVTTGCASAGANNEPCYNETIQAGAGQQTPGVAPALDRQTFTRLTCVRRVLDDDPELPADPLEPPSSWTCPSCDPATQPTCSLNTKRVKVAVIPKLLGNADANTAVDPERATLETVLTPIVRP